MSISFARFVLVALSSLCLWATAGVSAAQTTTSSQATPDRAKTHWEWSQKVRFVADHDPSRIVVQGKQRINMEVIYDDIDWEQVNAWPQGKTLLLAYSGKTGTLLLNPDTGKSVTVLDGLPQQPIDLLMQNCLDGAQTSLDIRDCYAAAYSRWDRQMNLWYQRFMTSQSAGINAAAKKALRTAQRQWLKFRDAQFSAINAEYGPRQGSIWPTIAISKRVALPKQRALAIASYLQAF